jgi:anti-sigma regulatory factor (Ser/Thr protein kinase)
VAFDGGVDMIPAARDFAARFLARLRESGTPVAPGREDHAVLVVSELVTNAHRHAPGPCRLELAAADGALRIAVTDTSPEHPRPRPPRPDRIGGHGLEIVLAMCHAIETFDEPGEAGKTVRVTLPLR